MRQQFLFSTLFLLCSTWAQSQQYNTALGLRLGGEMGISLQQRIGQRYTVEGLIQQGLTNNTTTFTGLLQKHYPVLGRNMNLYMGAGPHVGLAPASTDKDQQGRVGFAGATLIAGGELRLNRMLFSVDYKPAIHFAGRDQVFDGQTGISVRYILVKAPQKNKQLRWPFGKQKKANKHDAPKKKTIFNKT